MEEIKSLMERAAGLELSGAAARKAGEETAADGFFHRALEFAVKAVDQSAAAGSLHVRLNVLQATARLSLDCGDVVAARRLIDEASDVEGFREQRDEWAELRDPSVWPDGWLIAAVRRDPPDGAVWVICCAARCRELVVICPKVRLLIRRAPTAPGLVRLRC